MNPNQNQPQSQPQNSQQNLNGLTSDQLAAALGFATHISGKLMAQGYTDFADMSKPQQPQAPQGQPTHLQPETPSEPESPQEDKGEPKEDLTSQVENMKGEMRSMMDTLHAETKTHIEQSVKSGLEDIKKMLNDALK